MIVVLSGEGPTDLGQCSNAQHLCAGDDFQIGPMTFMLNQMLESRGQISSGCQYISKGGLAKRATDRKSNGGRYSFVGKKRGQEAGYFYINAWMLAEFSLELEKQLQDKVIAVLFRDCDPTRSSRSDLCEIKWKSMLDGFARADFSRGVPMIPKPISEAWLLCAAQPAVNNCAHLEEISRSDDSHSPAKSQLDGVFGAHKSGTELCEWLEANPIDETKLSTMPSFLAFKNRLDEVVADVVH